VSAVTSRRALLQEPRRPAVPAHSLLIIGASAATGRIHESDIVLRRKKSVGGCPQVPLQGSGVILCHPQPSQIQAAQIVLCCKIALISGHTVPTRRLHIISFHTRSGLIRYAHLKLHRAVAHSRLSEETLKEL
jgi:hypothetical protein